MGKSGRRSRSQSRSRSRSRPRKSDSRRDGRRDRDRDRERDRDSSRYESRTERRARERERGRDKERRSRSPDSDTSTSKRPKTDTTKAAASQLQMGLAIKAARDAKLAEASKCVQPPTSPVLLQGRLCVAWTWCRVCVLVWAYDQRTRYDAVRPSPELQTKTKQATKSGQGWLGCADNRTRDQAISRDCSPAMLVNPACQR